jgi:aqualysin 1
MKSLLISLLAAVAVLSALVLIPPAVVGQGVELPAQAFGESQPIPGRYIVVFKDQVANPAAEAASIMRGRGGQIHFTYSHAIKGFAATIPDAAYQAIRMSPNVEYIEQDQTVSLSATQNNATWGLDRIDQHDRPLDGKYNYDTTAPSVHAFIIDTGIRASHVDFSGRVQSGYTVINDGRGTNDCNGHGTHVAGTVGGVTWGVAKAVMLVPVRVLNCQGSGTLSGVIAGVDWVAAQTSRRPAVANMSWAVGPRVRWTRR